ncbi:MAG TPA: EVE domain-containing protein [Gemmatimonadales bacterium]|jgi:predicted RNA-binding protein with PUA-like domain|nr:EVE domain-containing protein [Gemmatimonadales bacterium]
MAAHWLLKTEPSTYSFADLQREQCTTWDGVSNPTALRHIRAMKNGDQAFIYHTGDEKAIVGVARIVSNPYEDPVLKDPKRAVVDLAPVRPLKHPITLAAVKADSRFADFALVRIPRLSVMPVSPEQWEALLSL